MSRTRKVTTGTKVSATVASLAVASFIGYASYTETVTIPAFEDTIKSQEKTIHSDKLQIDDLLSVQERNESTITSLENIGKEQSEKIDALNRQRNTLGRDNEALRKKISNLEYALKREKEKAVYRRSTPHTQVKGATTRAAASNSNSRIIGTNFQVTWYNDYGKTASTRFVQDGVTVAVDPSVIPLGTWLKITMPDGTEYIRRADDTGGKVKGHIVDIYAPVSETELYQRGRTHGATVAILDK